MAHRRSAGEGSLHFWKKKGLWVGRLTLPDGKRKRKTNKRQQVVKDWLLLERGKLAQGIYIADDKITIEAFMLRYLEDYAKRSLRVTTYQFYEGWTRRHIIPQLGKIRLTQLRANHINQFLTKMSDSGLSNRSVGMILAILKQALNKAVKWELIIKNPADLVSPPKVNEATPTVWTREQVNTFLKSLQGDRWAAIYYLACTGMRKGEILGLPLKALDLEKGYLTVIQTLQFLPGQGKFLLPPKTEKSKRLIRLPEFVKESLRAHLVRRESISKNLSWKDSGLVFTNDTGGAIFPTNLLRHFKAKLKSAGLPKIRFHDIRHTVASLLLAEKNVHPKFVSELLGHSSVNVTLNRYTHVINPMNTVVSDSLDEIMGSP